MAMTHRRSLVAANWKMNGTLATVKPLLEEITKGISSGCEADVVICPPYVYVPELSKLLRDTGIYLGAQNVSNYDAGAYTGEISVAMLNEYNCQFVIIGHSERRHIYGETDEIVAEKFMQVHKAGLTPILCVGEQLQERQADNTEEVIARQIDTVIDKTGIAPFKDAIVAYEPVWAIGTGQNATPLQAQQVHAFIRLRLARHDDNIADAIRILYGGSVKTDNSEEIFSMADVDGGLIGGASLVARDFLTICQNAR